MDGVLKIMFVEDVKSDAELIWREIDKNKIAFEKLLVDNRKDFLQGLKSFNPDIIISDYSLPQFDGMSALILRNELTPFIPFILVTGSINEEIAVECMKAGADDYILKENLSRLGPAVENSINKIKLLKEKKVAEEAMCESERRYHDLIESANDLIQVVDPDGKFLLVNKKWLETLEYSKEEVKDLLITDILCENQINRTMGLMQGIARGKKVIGFKTAFITKRGKEIYVEGNGNGIFKDGKFISAVGIFRDITERKQAEDAIKQERRMLRTLIDNLPDMIYVKDNECRKVIANVADVKNIGLEKEEDVLGKTDLDLFPDQTGVRGYADDKEVINSGKSIIDREEDFINSMGERRWLLTSKIALHDKDGIITGLVGIGHDITERKRMEEELIKAKDKAEESDKLKTAFLHNISHEIRTPMNAIVGFSTLLGEPDVDEQSRQEYIETIVQSSNHLLAIISDIVDISNIEANLVKIAKNEIDLNSTLKNCAISSFLKQMKRNCH